MFAVIGSTIIPVRAHYPSSIGAKDRRVQVYAQDAVKPVKKMGKIREKSRINKALSAVKRHKYTQWTIARWKKLCALMHSRDKAFWVRCVPAAIAAACVGGKAVHYACIERVLPDDYALLLSKLSLVEKKQILAGDWSSLGLLNKADIDASHIDGILTHCAQNCFDSESRTNAIHNIIAQNKRESVFAQVAPEAPEQLHDCFEEHEEERKSSNAEENDSVEEERKEGTEEERKYVHADHMQQHISQPAQNFFEHAVGMNEKAFRQQFGWDEHCGYLSQAPLDSMQKFMQFWDEKWPRIAELIRSHSDYALQTISELDAEINRTCIDYQSGRLKKVNARAHFELILHGEQDENGQQRETEITALQADAENADMAIQVASTRSVLEGGVSRHKNGLGSMLHSPVQGEWASLGAAKAAFFRKYIMPSIRYIRGERAAPQSRLGRLWRQLWNGNSANVSIPPVYDILEGDDPANWGIFMHCDVAVTGKQVRPQFDKKNGKRSSCEMLFIDNGHTVNQVFNAAVNCNLGGRCPSEDMQKKAQAVLKCMCEGIIKSAYLCGVREVQLTLLGGGAFRNDITWIQAALINPELVAFIKASGIHVRVTYRDDSGRRDFPVRDADSDIAFIQEIYRVTDFINNSGPADDEDNMNAHAQDQEAMVVDNNMSRDKVQLHLYFENIRKKYGEAFVRRMPIEARFDVKCANDLLRNKYVSPGLTVVQDVRLQEDPKKEACHQVVEEAVVHGLILIDNGPSFEEELRNIGRYGHSSKSNRVSCSDGLVQYYMSDKAPDWFKRAIKLGNKNDRETVFADALAQRKQQAHDREQLWLLQENNLVDEIGGQGGE